MRIQKVPNMIWDEKRLCLTRLRWERGPVGFGGTSNKVSISIQLKPQDLWVGAFWKRSEGGWTVWICLLPCLPIRIHWVKSYGGIYP
jgi:hypothetical protein